MYTQSINLSVIPEGVRPVIHCSQYDTNIQAFRFKLYVRGAEYIIPDGVAVLMNGKKPDGNGFSYAAASITGNVATFNTTQQMTAVAGDVLCELRVRASNQIIGTINFILRVEPAPLDDDTIISDTDIPLIEQAVEIAANLAQYIQETRDNAAAAQDSLKNSVKLAAYFVKAAVRDDPQIRMKKYLISMLWYLGLCAAAAVVDMLCSLCFSWIFKF